MSKINKPRLGRGLSSLISVDIPDEEIPPLPSEAPSALVGPSAKPAPAALVVETIPLTQRVIELPVADVRPNPHQPRRDFDETALKELAASLKTNGVIQPIVVRQSAGGYELIAGERRLRAAKIAGLSTVPAIVKEVDGLTQAQFALVENIQRENLNPIERAEAYKLLLQQLGLSHSELAGRLGEDRSAVSNHLRLLELAVPVRELIRSAKLTLGHAKVLAGVSDVLEQERLGKLVVEQGLSVRNLETIVQSLGSPAATKPTKPATTAHLRDLEKAISSHLGMRVSLRSKTNTKGSLVINYVNLDQFDEIMTRLGVKLSETE
ncbi:ParB/RepB/Spo0J family partition protein [Humisphaera borealis]|uniref:ParB/RepB/Spo0J family partition protein n=1 Tax=Humisphaera borealis TaxID=2807512 RepID=A0A7M2WS18_9BACT|nr:ParB/RepB/Spo0J family partition protein [Humisphaera borealis]QOV87581.1 ParB/RepB/Spo0J family partition protein [Humisphaera borealis]